jgi:hypothetical protein
MFLDEVDTLYGSLVPFNPGEDMFTMLQGSYDDFPVTL